MRGSDDFPLITAGDAFEPDALNLLPLGPIHIGVFKATYTSPSVELYFVLNEYMKRYFGPDIYILICKSTLKIDSR